MYAVTKTGGKQYRVSTGLVFTVEKLSVEVGEKVVFDEVLLLKQGENEQLSIGDPLVKVAQVSATVVAQVKGEKIKIFKMKRRKHHRKTQGHRQQLTRIRVDEITS